VLAALKEKMDLSLGIAIGSSQQIALFVSPVLVFTSYLFGPPISLESSFPEMAAVELADWIVAEISGSHNARSGFTPLESITSSLNVICYGVAPLTNIFSGMVQPHRATIKLNAIMKTWFTSNGISKCRCSESNQTSNRLQNATSGSLLAGKQTLSGLRWSVQSCGSPIHPRDMASFMQSQLG
jgi:hypothetical protein